MKVFLGGTCSGWKWRDQLQKMLDCDYYNPIVKIGVKKTDCGKSRKEKNLTMFCMALRMVLKEYTVLQK